MSASTKVQPFLRVVANGTRSQDGKTMLRVTLIATPELVKADPSATPSSTPADLSGRGFDLSRWPSELAKRIREGQAPAISPFGIRLRLRLIAAPGRPLVDAWESVDASIVTHKSAKLSSWDRVTEQWQLAFGGVIGDPWRPLAEDIDRSLQGSKHRADLRADYTLPVDPPDQTFDLDGAILADGPAATEQAVIKGVVPLRQGEFAIDEERVRAARVLAKMQAGADRFDDDHGLVLDAAKQKPAEGFDEARRKVLYEEFKLAVQQTDKQRSQSRIMFDEVSKLVKGEAAENATTFTLPGDRTVVPPADHVRSGERRAEKRSTHAYGTWLQRRKDYNVKRSHPEAPLTAKPDVAGTTGQSREQRFERNRGVFYALQGDPFLSRLFCLTFDLEFELPKWLEGDGAKYLHLAAEWDDENGRSTPVVATSAKLEGASFWPVSVFEAGIVGTGANARRIDVPALVEQRDGVWLLHQGYSPDDPSKHEPRYDLTSLDVRRAVDSTPDGVDRGQRHLTAGFTILDHGRGHQVVRDIALAHLQQLEIKRSNGAGASRATVVLHAEELTIGRRVDVAAAAGGVPVGKAAWRSLMYRLVTYPDLEGPVADLVKVLLAGWRQGSAYLDEAAFQVAARYMPVVAQVQQAGSHDLEAVAEEAVFLWDGTPAGVLTEPGRGADAADQLPFRRTLQLLPAGGELAKLRAGLLLFGYPYLFRMRSLFLGGGSPSVDQTASYADGRTCLPPSLGDVLVPRRFLRHESVSPPILLLPRHLATAGLGVMGFEQADQAIVRTRMPSDLPPGGVPERIEEPGPPYVDVGSRTLPDRTMRVLVAPEVAAMTVCRHGKLEGQNVRAVLKGGLLDVAYEPAKRDAGAAVATGFPMVITETKPAFGTDGAIYRRVMAEKNGAKLGIPVFEPGGKNTTSEQQEGYLPDPAAEEMSIRLKIRGSGCYLKGDVAVDLYDAKKGIAYPHALPVVVEVQRMDGERPAPATAITEVISTENGSLRWMSPSGEVTPGKKNGKSTRVRYLRVRLFRGEDFDLEAVCLPKEELLARTFSIPETLAIQLAEAEGNQGQRSELEVLSGQIDLAGYAFSKGGRYTGLAGRLVPEGDTVRKVARDILATIKARWPVEELASVTRLRVCHAINSPAAAPDLSGPIKGRRPRLQELPDGTRFPTVYDIPGEKVLVLSGEMKLDLEQADAFELVATTAAASARPLDDVSRSRSLISRRSGRWPKLTVNGGSQRYIAPRHVVGFDVDAQGRVTLPKETITLLRVDNLPPRAVAGAGESLFGRRENRLTTIRLDRLYTAALTGAPIEIPAGCDAPGTARRDVSETMRRITVAQPNAIADTRARKLELHVVAISRFAEAFATAPRYHGGDAPLLDRRQPLKPIDQSRSSAPVEVWVPASVRPAAPTVRRPEVSPVIERRASDGRNGGWIQSLERTVMTRLYLGRGWYSSGEGERLGIVLWPPKYFDQTQEDVDRSIVRLAGREIDVAAFDDRDLGPGGAYVTRWGGDPMRRDAYPQTGVFIPPEAFLDAADTCQSPHRPTVVRDALLPIRRSPDGPNGKEDERREDDSELSGFLPVSLLTYEPCFDLDREEWYVDVDLKPSRASEPFVRFGLVRYQEHAINDELRVSYPVRAHAQVMPNRYLTLTDAKCSNGDPAVEITLSGYGSTDIKSLRIEEVFANDPRLQDLLRAFGQIRRPEMRVTIVHEAPGAPGLTLRTSVLTPEPWIRVPAKLENATLRWSVQVPLPTERIDDLGPGTLVAYIEELDRRLPASYPSEPVSQAGMFDPKTFRDSGPRFNARVAFLNLPARPNVTATP